MGDNEDCEETLSSDVRKNDEEEEEESNFGEGAMAR
jgi:hypothetical protein